MRRLYTRIYFHFLGVLLVVGVATSIVFATGVRSEFLHRSAERFAHHAARLVSDRWDDPAARARVVHHLSDELGIDVTLRDPAGKVVDVAGTELPPPREPPQHPGIHFGRRHFPFAVAPIVRGGQVVGVLEVSPMRRVDGPSLVRPIGIAAFVLLVVGLAVAPLARRISRPVERLTEASRRFGGGDLDYRVPVRQRHKWHRRDDELTELMRAWNEMAERVQKLVSGQKELLANVSHELRSPLARIRVALELVPRDGSTEGRLRDIEQDLAELDRLIDDVLTASRLDAAQLPLHRGPVEAQALLSQLAERAAHDPACAGKPVRVEAAVPVELDADAALLKRALWNLVENAGKYGAPPITLAARREGGRVEFSITDEGPGIAPADRERVLEPFWRADKAHTAGGGVGLGLTLARRIAAAHGGSIAIGDHDGHGCRVVLSIPA